MTFQEIFEIAASMPNGQLRLHKHRFYRATASFKLTLNLKLAFELRFLAQPKPVAIGTAHHIFDCFPRAR